MTSRIRKFKRVALLVDSMMAPRRTMMNGVARFMLEHEPWSIYVKPPFVDSDLGRWLKRWRGDGVLGNLSPANIGALRKAGIPFVDTAGFLRDDNVPLVRSDDHAIGRMGAEHLLERGFRHFAFFELADAYWARNRYEGFDSRLRESGFFAHRQTALKPSAGPTGPDAWDRQQQKIGQWIAELPKPIGIMTTTDFLGRQVLEACQRFEINVPDTVAVLGVDNDEPICRISMPPLSSVIVNDEQRGYLMAALLAKLMEGKRPDNLEILVSPTGVMTRASTDVFAFQDEQMIAAIRYLRDHLEEYSGAEDMARSLDISRSALDRKFCRLLGHTVNEEVIRLRINRAIRLLAETGLPLKSIALRCGFSSQSYMSTVFRSKLGRTPASFRR